jgi:predicted outer membrane repeat protein
MDIMRRRFAQPALLASGLSMAALAAIAVCSPQAVHAATFAVPCDPFALRNAMATVNSNRQPDSLSLAPGCVYLLTETLSIASDGGQPVQIDGRGATLSGDSRRGVIIVDPGATLRLNHATVTLGAADLGAGILNGGTVELLDCDVAANGAQVRGGGILNSGVLTVTDSNIHGNGSSSGGGLYNGIGATATLKNTTFQGNNATSGGGIFSEGDALTLIANQLSGNDALDAGGILNSRGTATLVDTAVLANSAVTDGIVEGTGNGGTAGGIRNAALGTLVLSYSTVAANPAHANHDVGGGGGVVNSGRFQLDNSIIADNTRGGDCINNGTISPTGRNIIEDGGCSVPGALTVDPKLGGVALGLGSPAIDAASGGSCPAVDVRGAPRPQDGNGDGVAVCDIGAYEADPPPPACGLVGIELFLVLPLARGLARARDGLRRGGHRRVAHAAFVALARSKRYGGGHGWGR